MPSPSDYWHAQAWAIEHGLGQVPLAFRSGHYVYVNVERLTPEQRAALGVK